jgi:hypothetical protein
MTTVLSLKIEAKGTPNSEQREGEGREKSRQNKKRAQREEGIRIGGS